MAEEAVIDVPSYFLCPISLQIMKDPVTVLTGITYDRESIERWLLIQKNDTCPVTKQVITDTELIPNITLRRLIQSWCALHASEGIERLPTPKAPASKAQILKLLKEGKSHPQNQMITLKRLRSISSQSHANRVSMEGAGAGQFLASLIVDKTIEAARAQLAEDLSDIKKTCEEALSILHNLQLSESGLNYLNNNEFIDSMVLIMQCGSYDSRAYAVMILKEMLEVADPSVMINLRHEFFSELAQIVNDQISMKATKAALNVLISACPWGKNRVKATESGITRVLIDLLLDTSDKRACEMMLVALDLLCQCAEGRAELLKHSAGLAIVSKKILRVSHVASESAVRILHSVAKFSATPLVLQEMLQIGVVAKLCLVLQVNCGPKIKDRAKDMLKVHARAWKSSPCNPKGFLSSYPL